MERRYVPLRPSSPRAIEQEHSADSESLEPKRPRVGVSVACNDCRRKKIRCDGQRPVCSNCQGKTDQCEYRDEGGPSKESRNLVVEVIQTLGQLPTAEAIQYLDGLKDENDALTILSTLRQGLTCKQLETDNATATPGFVDNGQATPQEWQTQNPTAYPGRAGRDTNLFQKQPYRELTETPRHDFYANMSMSGQQSTMPQNEAMRDEHQKSTQESYQFCDPRLCKLNIRYWTNVDIDDDLAAKCISLYLETDHPLLGHFDPDLFVSHLISEQSEYCSPLLVNSLLYWACQMYSAIDTRTDPLAIDFCAEAEGYWTNERYKGDDSMLILAATEFLCLGYLGQGRDHAVLRYLSEAANMAGRMGLFSAEGQVDEINTRNYADLTGAAKTSHMYAAWGIFNWLTLMSLFYHQPGMLCPTSPPRIPIPKRCTLDTSQGGPFRHNTEDVSSLPEYMGDTFPYLCRFWTIVREVSWVYHARGHLPWGSRSSLAFAEFKFRELLAWSNSLPPQLSANQHGQHHHVQVMHLWFHAAVLDIFRPFIHNVSHRNQYLTTFNNPTFTPKAICEHSTTRLKRLIINYRLNYTSSNFTILWHTALIYVANALFENDKDEEWYSYLLLCLYGYQRLSRSWRVAEGISMALLSMALRNGDISSTAARRILSDFKNRTSDGISGGIRATFMVDLHRSLSEPNSSTAEYLADQFEGNMMMSDYTTIFDERHRD